MIKVNTFFILFIIELTINDFANATCPRGRFRKAVTTKVIKCKENTLDQIDIDESFTHNNNNRRKKKCKEMEKEDPNHIYNDYHIDIWFLISEYIEPEDVGRFALICKKTDAVVSSAKFWYNLYRKYYSSSVGLPQRLQPECMVRLGELRAKVICSLFYTYLPFVRRLKLPPNLNILINLECTSTWHKQEDKTWIFCYRFVNRIQTRKFPRYEMLKNIKNKKNTKKTNENDSDDDDVFNLDDDDCFDEFISQFNNIYDNPSEGHHLLVVFTKRFIPFPKFNGQKAFLNSARKPISNDLRNFNLELKFNNYRNEIINTVLYDDVLKFRIINWWHPDYMLFSSL